ncbi:MAG TPA: LCP family protein [Acidimicrobiales bacterium]|nr:LCP family protein [Acidimicrobiales bacterium]
MSATDSGDAPTLSRQARRAQLRRRRRHRKLKWTLLTLGGVIVLLVAVVGGYTIYLNSKIVRITVKTLKPPPAKGVNQSSENILMVGSTSRCALKIQNPAYGLCSQGVTGVNSDVIMILHLNPSKHSISILSIPRDLFVPNARAEGANKIDAALYEGPSQLVNAIQEDFGIPIQHYVELNFDTFASIVDALGGINMYFPEPVFDQYSGLNVQTTGCLHLDGVHALQVVRARHLQYKGPGVTTTDPYYWPQEGESDLARIRRDHEFLRVLATAVAQRGLGNLLTDERIISSVAPQLTVDSGFSSTHMVNLALTYHGTNAYDVPQLTLPVMVGSFGQYFYKGGGYGDVEFPTQPEDQDVIDQFLGVSASTDTMSGGQLPDASAVTVSILNGSGISSALTAAMSGLQALGFDVVGSGYASPVAPEAETVVEYAQQTPTDLAAAQAVARSLTGQVIMAMGPTTDGAEVTVLTGSDFAVNAPPGTATSTTTTVVPASGAPTTTPAAPPTTTTTIPPGFDPATAPVEALSAWDPRSCTAGGAEGL